MCLKLVSQGTVVAPSSTIPRPAVGRRGFPAVFDNCHLKRMFTASRLQSQLDSCHVIVSVEFGLES